MNAAKMTSSTVELPLSGELSRQMDAIYSLRDEADIPWFSAEIPAELTELAESGWVGPCRALDLGCGTGMYAIWFAQRGFEMTGADLSEEAVRTARKHAEESGANCRFIAADLCTSIEGLGERSFDFAYDWEVLHHIAPVQRSAYLANVRRLLRTGAKYYSASFSIEDPQFGGSGSIRTTPIGTRLYFSSLAELRALYAPLFVIESLEVITVHGKRGDHKLAAAHLLVPGI